MPSQENGKTTKTSEAENPLRIVGTAFHIDRNQSFLAVEYPSLEGRQKRMLIPRELFRVPTRVADELIRCDARLDAPVAAVKMAIAKMDGRTLPHIQLTRRTGWVGETSFVYPTKTFGALDGKFLYDPVDQIDPSLGQAKGCLRSWRQGLREPCRHSDYLIFAVSVGPASCLLDITGHAEGAIFHLHGTTRQLKDDTVKTKSSSGKTLTIRAGVSTMGACGTNDLFSFAITERAVEDFCFSRNNLLVALDEEGRSADATSSRVRTVSLPYIIPAGRGAVRSNRATSDGNLKNLTWSILALSTGEYPLDDPRRAPRPEGAQVRMIGIPVPPGENGGIFNRVNGSRSAVLKKCKMLARLVESTISGSYGFAMPAFLEEVVRLRPSLKPRVISLVTEFVNSLCTNGSPWERRFAEKFGFVFAAAILMAELKIGPWTKKRARRAVKAMYTRARSANVTISQATDAVLSRLKKRLKTGKFPELKKGGKPDGSSVGFVRRLSKGRIALIIRRSNFGALCHPPAVTSAVLAELAARGVLIKDADGKHTQQIKLIGSNERQRFVCLDFKKLTRPEAQ